MKRVFGAVLLVIGISLLLASCASAGKDYFPANLPIGAALEVLDSKGNALPSHVASQPGSSSYVVDGESFMIRWHSKGATACLLTAPTGTSGITRNGDSGLIKLDHPWYPKKSGDASSFTILCMSEKSEAKYSVSIYRK